MNLKNFLRVALIAMAGLVVAGTSARGATVVTASGDLILSFRTNQASSDFNLLVDLGPASTILNLAPGTYNFNLGGALGPNLGLSIQDLRNVFGNGTTDASWNGIADLVWSVAGASGGSTNNLLYVTSPTDTLTNRSGSIQNGVRGTIEGVRVQLNGQTGLISPQSAKIPSAIGNSYSIAIRNGDPGSYTNDYNYNLWGTSTTEADVPSTGVSTLNFFKLQSGTQGTQQPVGAFSLSSDGILTYTVVPEPTTASLIAAASVGFLGLRRRRPVVKA